MSKPITRHTRSSGSFMLLCLLLVPIAVMITSCKGETTNKKTEEDEVRDEGKRPEGEPEENPIGELKPADNFNIPNTAEGKRILEHINIMYSLGADAEKNYQASLAELRRNAKVNVEILTAAYDKAEAIAYADRWTVLQTITDMEVPEAAEQLIRYAKAELPGRDTTQYDDAISPYNEETVLRITAIDGIAKLSKVNDEALRAMPGFFQHKDPVIRLEALNRFADAIRTVRDTKKQAEMIKLFPSDYEFELRPKEYPVPGIENPGLKPSGEGKGEAPKSSNQ